MRLLGFRLFVISLVLFPLTGLAVDNPQFVKAPLNKHPLTKLNASSFENSISFVGNSRSVMLLKLQEAYDFYNDLIKIDNWPPIPSGRTISFSDQHPHVPLLREKLIKLGDHPPVECEQLNDPLFDIELEEALVRFQQRHGDEADGILGPKTRRQINITPNQRAKQLKVNIARIEAFNPTSDRFVHVNIPEYRLYLYEQNSPILTMKTIVGKKKRKTPIFDSVINRIVINPSWHVPKSIAYRDIIPALKEDPTYLKKVNLKVVSGWGKTKKFIRDENINYDKLYLGDNYQRFWEAPSDMNTLGSVKFLTNSPYSIYLHDTSAKRLFNQNKRAFSSGCIRLEQPRKLADELMRMTHGWHSTQLDPIFSQKETKEFRLTEPIDLYVTYWTAWIDPEGKVNFRDDIYKHDIYEFSKKD